MPDSPYVTTRRRRIASIFLGALLGSLIMAFPMGYITSEGRIVDSPGDVFFSFALCGILWLVGIAGFASPIWLLIEKRRKNMGWPTAALCGLILSAVWAVIVTVTVPSLVQDDYDLTFWLGPMGFALAVGALACSAVGCVVALAMWRFAYRRVAARDIAETFS